MADKHHELLNIYNADGEVVGARPRSEAKSSDGLAAGAVQLLLVGPGRKVLLQKRRDDKENGGLWDKSVGGHVLAGESFDQALLREANEELFGAAEANKVAIVGAFDGSVTTAPILVRRIRFELGLRDVRFASTPEREIINVTYHAAMYLGRADIPIEAFARQDEELADLRYFDAAEVDRMLVTNRLAPNMNFLWFALGRHAATI